MTEKKKASAPPLKQAGATQRMSKDELAELLKKAEADDPDQHAPDDSSDSDDDSSEAAQKPAQKK